MANIYVSPLASPSFECLSGAADLPTNEFLKPGEDKQEVRGLDENANEIFETARKTSGIMKGHEFETPSGTITTISVSPGSPPIGSPTRSPVYCFHSFTYGVNAGSNENVAAGLRDGGNMPAELNGTAASDLEDESFDADSPNVLRTRTVVDPDVAGSPRILCNWNMGEAAEYLSNVSDSLSSKETSLSIEPSKANQSEISVGLQNPEAVKANSTIGKGPPTLPTVKGTENSTDGSCDNAAKAPVRRLSPEGAECNAVDAQMSDATGDTSYIMVPDKRVVAVQRMDLAGSPSGLLDVKNYWMWDDVVEGTGETVDSDFQDHLPLLGAEKPHVRYKTEEGLEEAEEGSPVTCFPCRYCVVL